MKIPNKVKVGGLVYSVYLTDYLKLGRAAYSGEIDYEGLEIRIGASLDDKKKRETFIHELTHALFEFCGYTEQDEEMISRLAQAMLMVIEDNKEIFETEASDEKR